MNICIVTERIGRGSGENMEHQELAELFLKHIVEEGIHKRYGDTIPPEVTDRINLEYDVIIPNKFTDYILMVWDIHEFCKTPLRVNMFCAENNIEPPPTGIIPIGPGRGSVGGSMVCYAIGITQCDPLLFGLFFERFLNPERIAYPDIDFDVSQKYRHIVVEYISQTYGADHVSQIVTYGTLSKNNVVHDVLASFGVPEYFIKNIKQTIPEDPACELSDIINDEKFKKEWANTPLQSQSFTIDKSNVDKILQANRISGENLEAAVRVKTGTSISEDILIQPSMTMDELLNICLRLEKLNKNVSKHAAGVVVAPVPMDGNIPLMADKDGSLVCQYEKQEVESLGFLKMDVLGLRTVDVNYDAEQLVKNIYNKDFDLYSIPYNDEQAIKLINDGDNNGIFQIEGNGFTRMMQDLDIGGYEVERFTDEDKSKQPYIKQQRGDEIHDFMWISAGLALYRPGPLDAIIEGKTMVQHLIDRKSGKEPITYLFSEEKEYLEETYGVLVYQEQVMSRVRAMTGCSYGRADILRKAMGKKDPVLMKEQMDWFKDAAMQYDFTNDSLCKDIEHKRKVVERASDEIEKFARYGFNKAHTVEYAHICYHNAYLKSHYKDCFYCAIINSINDKPEKQSLMIRDMLNHDVELLPPDINESEVDFVVKDKNEVRFGFGAIKQFGKKAKLVMQDRILRGRYSCVDEFRIRISASDANKTVITNLAKCGAFDSLLKNNAGTQFENRATLVETMPNICNALNKLRRKKPKSPEPPTVDEALDKWYNGAGKYTVINMDDDPIQYSIWEKEIIKYYISAHPIDAYKMRCVGGAQCRAKKLQICQMKYI